MLARWGQSYWTRQLSETTQLLTTTSAAATTPATPPLLDFLWFSMLALTNSSTVSSQVGTLARRRGLSSPDSSSRFRLSASTTRIGADRHHLVICLRLARIAIGVVSVARSGSRPTTASDGFDFNVILVIVIKGRFTSHRIVRRFRAKSSRCESPSSRLRPRPRPRRPLRRVRERGASSSAFLIFAWAIGDQVGVQTRRFHRCSSVDSSLRPSRSRLALVLAHRVLATRVAVFRVALAQSDFAVDVLGRLSHREVGVLEIVSRRTQCFGVIRSVPMNRNVRCESEGSRDCERGRVSPRSASPSEARCREPLRPRRRRGDSSPASRLDPLS